MELCWEGIQLSLMIGVTLLMTSSTNHLTNYIYTDELVNAFAQLDDNIYTWMVQANGLAKMNTMAHDYVLNELQPQIEAQLKYLDDDLEEWQQKQVIKRVVELILKNEDIAQSAKENLAVINSNIRKIKRRFKWLQIKHKFHI